MWNTPSTIPGSTIYKQATIGKLTISGGYVLGSFSSWKRPVNAATTANVTPYGIQTIDNVDLVNGSRILLKNQSLEVQNGIYVVSESAWYRSDDLPTGSLAASIVIAVIAGFTNANKLFTCTNEESDAIVGTNDLVFAEISGGGGGNTNITWKEPAKLATTVDIALTNMRTIDGVLTVVNDRILVKDQANQVENGIYLAKVGAWTRAPDFADGYLPTGSFVYITDGDTNAQKTFVCNSPNIVGVGDVTFINLIPPTAAGGADTYLQYNNGGVLDGVPGMVYNGTDNELVLGYQEPTFTITTHKDVGTGDASDLFITIAGSDQEFPSSTGDLTITGGGGYYVGGSVAISGGPTNVPTGGAPGSVTINGGADGFTSEIIGSVIINGHTSITSTNLITLTSVNGVYLPQSGLILTPTFVTVSDEFQPVTIDALQGVITFTSVSAVANSNTIVNVSNNMYTTQILLVSMWGYSGTGIPIVQTLGGIFGGFALQITNVSSTDPLSGTLAVSFVMF